MKCNGTMKLTFLFFSLTITLLSSVCHKWQWRIQGRGPGGRPLPYFWTKLRPDVFLRPPPPPYLRVGMPPPPPPPLPLSEGLDPPLNGVGEGHRCCSRLNLKISLKISYEWVGQANWFNYTDLLAATGKNCVWSGLYLTNYWTQI